MDISVTKIIKFVGETTNILLVLLHIKPSAD